MTVRYVACARLAFENHSKPQLCDGLADTCFVKWTPIEPAQLDHLINETFDGIQAKRDADRFIYPYVVLWKICLAGSR